ncbi:bacillithiol system redox-active protein YtxJ, partial [bacterium]|nr:bacillithiol system redox-active protein YtxJ [bacterium]
HQNLHNPRVNALQHGQYFCGANLPLPMDWQHLRSIDDFHAAVRASKQDPVVIFKHSTRCPTSAMALRLTEQRWSLPAEVRAYFLDLIAHRDVSQAIATELGVDHESPQMIFLRDGVVLHHASHHRIDPTDLVSYL